LAEITARAEQWHKRGADVELLDADQAAKKLGTTKYAGALLDRRAGTIQPLAYARGLANAALKAGARIFTKSPVRTIDRKDGRWQVRGEDAVISAEWVIVATDAYGTGPGLPVRKEQVLLPYFNFATKPLPPEVRTTILPEKQGAWDTQLVMTSFRMDQAGRLIFGSIGALRGTGLAVHRSWANRALRKLFPNIGEVVFEAEWFGMIGLTKNNLPRFHKYADRMIGFSGYNGRGIAPGTTFGRTLAQYVTGEIRDSDLPLPVTPIEKATFRAAKQMFYEVSSQLAHIVSARAPS
jgi:glycine/D-amino acid oxidase-like deaminating enzyme